MGGWMDGCSKDIILRNSLLGDALLDNYVYCVSTK